LTVNGMPRSTNASPMMMTSFARTVTGWGEKGSKALKPPLPFGTRTAGCLSRTDRTPKPRRYWARDPRGQRSQRSYPVDFQAPRDEDGSLGDSPGGRYDPDDSSEQRRSATK